MISYYKFILAYLLFVLLSHGVSAMEMSKKRAKLSDRLIPVFTPEQKEFAKYQLLCGSNSEQKYSKKNVLLAETCFNLPIEEMKKNGMLNYKSGVPQKRPFHEISKATEFKPLNAKPRLESTFNIPEIIDDFYYTIMDSSPENILAIATEEKIYLLDSTNFNSTLIDIKNEYPITSVHFFGKGKYLAFGSDDGILYVWNMKDKRLDRKIKLEYSRICALTSLSDNSFILFTGSLEGQIRKLDLTKIDPVVATYSLDNNMKGHYGEVCGLAIHPQGKYLISGGNDNNVYFWDIQSDNPNDDGVFGLEEHHKAAVKAIAWHKDGRYFATGAGSADKHIRIWDIVTKQLVMLVNTHSQISSLKWVGNRLFSTQGFNSNDLKSWIVDFNNSIIFAEYTCQGHTKRICASALIDDQKTLVTLDSNSALKFWDISKKVQNPDNHQREEKTIKSWHLSIR